MYASIDVAFMRAHATHGVLMTRLRQEVHVIEVRVKCVRSLKLLGAHEWRHSVHDAASPTVPNGAVVFVRCVRMSICQQLCPPVIGRWHGGLGAFGRGRIERGCASSRALPVGAGSAARASRALCRLGRRGSGAVGCEPEIKRRWGMA
eukprot:scaffold266757_cov32-Tisochrysis_lutea.AAC.2